MEKFAGLACGLGHRRVWSMLHSIPPGRDRSLRAMTGRNSNGLLDRRRTSFFGNKICLQQLRVWNGPALYQLPGVRGGYERKAEIRPEIRRRVRDTGFTRRWILKFHFKNPVKNVKNSNPLQRKRFRARKLKRKFIFFVKNRSWKRIPDFYFYIKKTCK